MRQKVVWFILGVLVGSLFVVSAYPTTTELADADSETQISSSIVGIQNVISTLEQGQFVIVDTPALKTLTKRGVIPYAPIFTNNTLYAIKLLPGKRFFIYAQPNVKNEKEFLSRAKEEFKKIDFWKETFTVELANVSWEARAGEKTLGYHTASVDSTTNAYIESTIIWDSDDTWKPHGRLRLYWEVYKLADIDPNNDYRVVDMVTRVWAGRYLYPEGSGIGVWQTDNVKIGVNTKPDDNDIFTLGHFGPSHNEDFFDSTEPTPVSYTLGTGGASITITQKLELVKIKIDTVGDWVRWTYSFNRDLNKEDSYANSWGELEPGYEFMTKIPSSPTEAHQKLSVSVKWVYNRLYWIDDHFTGSITIDWIWHIG
jgi:hypothetical protein